MERRHYLCKLMITKKYKLIVMTILIFTWWTLYVYTKKKPSKYTIHWFINTIISFNIVWCVWKKFKSFWREGRHLVLVQKKCLIILFFCYFFFSSQTIFLFSRLAPPMSGRRACVIIIYIYLYVHKFYITANESCLIGLHCTVIVRYVLLLWSWTSRGNLQSVKINCDRWRRKVAVKNRPYYIWACTYHHAIMQYIGILYRVWVPLNFHHRFNHRNRDVQTL